MNPLILAFLALGLILSGWCALAIVGHFRSGDGTRTARWITLVGGLAAAALVVVIVADFVIGQVGFPLSASRKFAAINRSIHSRFLGSQPQAGKATSPGPAPCAGCVTTLSQPPSPGEQPCTASEVSAETTSTGPDTGMGTVQDLVTLRSSSPCVLDGYPTLEMSAAGTRFAITVSDGGTVGPDPKPVPVSVGPSQFASFILESAMTVPDSEKSRCPEATSLTIELPGSTVAIRVPFAPRMQQTTQSSWNACNLKVSAFAPGDNPLAY